ncbi:MAG: hypothetical protein J5J00_03325 [Deltaproteobacteria bacterium]|nr:hypothetical protein [Deltaproteobacteria bacterium]
MNTSMRLQLHAAEILGWFYAAFVITYQLGPVLSEGLTAGWDTTPHYYLTTRFVENLKSGRISGYDPLWLAGYAEFVLYPPLTYAYTSFLHLVSLGAFPILASYNLLLFLLPFAYLAAFAHLAATAFGVKYRLHALLLGVLTLCIPGEFGNFAIGLGGLANFGLLPSFLGSVLLLLFLAAIIELGREPRFSKFLRAILLLTAICLTHSITYLFANFCLFVLFVASPRARTLGVVAAVGIGAALLASFWLIPFVSNLWLSSSDAWGVQVQVPDPAFAVYGLPWYGGTAFSTIFRPGYVSLAIPLINSSVFLPEGVFLFPYPAAVLIVFGITGTAALMRSGKVFLLLLFVLSFIFLPRNFLIEFTSFGVHYYRFALFVMLLNALIAAFALTRLREALSSSRPIFKILSLPCYYAFGATILFVVPFVQYRAYGRTINWQGHVVPNVFYPKLKDYALNSDAERIVREICRRSPKGRVATENTVMGTGQLGTPHYFAVRLPLECKVPVLPGLLAESSYTAGFFIPTMAVGSEQLPWGRTELIKDWRFTTDSLNSMIKRLALFNVEYIVTTSRRYRENLRRRARRSALLLKRSGPFAIFRIKRPTGWNRKLSSAPFLYLEKRGGLSFRRFSEEWYKESHLLSTPVIFTKKSFSELPIEEKRRMAGIIIGSPPIGAEFAKDPDVQEALTLGLRVVILKPLAAGEINMPEQVSVIPKFPHAKSSRAALGKILLEAPRLETGGARRYIKWKGDREMIVSGEGPVLINYSYAEGWSAEDGRTVYMASPGLLMIFLEKKATLRYRQP